MKKKPNTDVRKSGPRASRSTVGSSGFRKRPGSSARSASTSTSAGQTIRSILNLLENTSWPGGYAKGYIIRCFDPAQFKNFDHNHAVYLDRKKAVRLMNQSNKQGILATIDEVALL